MKLDARVPTIDLQIEADDQTVSAGRSLDLEGPTSVKLILAIQGGKDWIIDVIRNGLLEMAHSSRHITDDHFSSVMNIAVHTSCTFRIACRTAETGMAVHTDSVVVRLRSGARFAQPWEMERRRIKGLLQRA